MRSHLLTGKVRHRRSQPKVYELEHDVFYLALDLAELDAVAARLRLFSRNRFNLLAFHDRDHWLPEASDLRASVLAHLRAEGFDPARWRITFIATPRVLGYQFNPASFYLCRDGSGSMAVVIVEVHNTHGERRLYTLRPQLRGKGWVDEMDKDFYVSPFIDMDAHYSVRVQDDPERIRIAITETEHGEPLLSATLMAGRKRLTDRTLLRTLLRIPLVTQKTIVAIHLHAWRMWRRGFLFHRHSEVTR
ncbi:MAG TPA: DUF1365 domain-containing protein [Anaerolineae bacterium]|nr:DUF1365 domain-containing protein [Anaerolineae bacterium]